MLLLDLAVPRDIDPAVGELDDVFLHTIDDLERAIEDNRRSRREAAAEAEAIVDLQVARFASAATGSVSFCVRMRRLARATQRRQRCRRRR